MLSLSSSCGPPGLRDSFVRRRTCLTTDCGRGRRDGVQTNTDGRNREKMKTHDRESRLLYIDHQAWQWTHIQRDKMGRKDKLWQRKSALLIETRVLSAWRAHLALSMKSVPVFHVVAKANCGACMRGAVENAQWAGREKCSMAECKIRTQ